MSRLSSLIVVVVAACGGSPKPSPGVPLPEDPKPAPAAEAAPPAAAGSAAQTPPAPTPPPRTPLEVKVPAPGTTVKLVSSGTGKKQAVRYTLKPGAKQTVEFVMDFTGKQDTDAKVVPTLVLTGEAETKTVDPDGNGEFAVTITGTDARAVEGSQIPIEQFKTALGALTGLTIGGKLSSTGSAGELTLHLDNAPPDLAEALQLIQLTLPRLPVLPKEAVGVGAKWQSITPAKLIERLDVTQTTEYQVTAHKGSTWTITGKTTVVGKDQEIEGAKITGISGTGTSETTIADGVLYPAHKASLETQFKVADKDKSATVTLKVAGAVTPKAP
jgi:hypothetical protein